MATTRLLSAMVATWNNVATTFTGLKLNVTDTASAAGSLLLDLQVGGASNFSVAKTGEVISASDFWVRSNAANAGVYWGSSGDVFLTRDAANTLALRNGTAAQSFNVYNTYTDASNYERGFIQFSGNEFQIGAASLGTGTVRNINLRSGSYLHLGSGAANRWLLDPSGHFLANTDNTYDIGASGANRPRDFFLGRTMTIGGYVTAQFIYLGTGASRFGSTADGVYRFGNNALSICADLTVSGASASGLSLATFGGPLAATTYLKSGSYTVATVPSASAAGAGARIYVSDESGGAVLAFSDGTNWRRVTDRAVIS